MGITFHRAFDCVADRAAALEDAVALGCERILTSGYHNEGPTFAPNGRVVMFFREAGGGPSLYTVDISEFAVGKLRDRGSLSVNSIVTNVQDFLINTARSLNVI